jgi:GWxTD domain-containing protein
MNIKARYKKLFLAVICIGLVLNFCSKPYYSKKGLSLEASEFISKVRYIITKNEKKRFFSLVTAEERQEFIKKFWKERDPDPETEENLFKKEYFRRIDLANHLFKDESKEGWLTDRGRVLILIGEPDFRRFRPGTIASTQSVKSWYNYPHEIWYYGFYPIMFIDELENGTLRLTPMGAQQVSTILETSLRLKPKVGKSKVPMDFNIKLNKHKDKTLTLQIALPYKNILFQQSEDGKEFSAVITIHVNIFDSKNNNIKKISEDKPISMSEDELLKAKSDHIMNITFKLEPGKYELEAILESKADDVRSRKKIKFKI